MIACNTIFGGDHLTFNITLPQTTFMSSSFTKCKYLFSLEDDVLCVCWPSWFLSTGHWLQSSRHLNWGVGTFNLDPPPPPIHAPKPLKRQSITVFTDHKAMLRIFEQNTSSILKLYSYSLWIISLASNWISNISLHNQKVILKLVVREAKYVLWSAFRAFWKEEGVSEAWRGNVGCGQLGDILGLPFPTDATHANPTAIQCKAIQCKTKKYKAVRDIISAFEAFISPGDISLLQSAILLCDLQYVLKHLGMPSSAMQCIATNMKPICWGWTRSFYWISQFRFFECKAIHE